MKTLALTEHPPVPANSSEHLASGFKGRAPGPVTLSLAPLSCPSGSSHAQFSYSAAASQRHNHIQSKTDRARPKTHVRRLDYDSLACPGLERTKSLRWSCQELHRPYIRSPSFSAALFFVVFLAPEPLVCVRTGKQLLSTRPPRI